MLYFDVLVGVLMIAAAIALFWFVRPVNGAVNSRLTPSIEPYVAVAILGLNAFGFIIVLFGLVSSSS
jgi:hypothetical protein